MATATIPAKPSTDATDMSKLPEMMSIVCPSEMMPITAIAERMLTRFCGVRNTSESRLARSPIVMSRMKAMLPRAARATPRSQPHDPSSNQARASRPGSLRMAFIPPASSVTLQVTSSGDFEVLAGGRAHDHLLRRLLTARTSR